jgi:small subunit ribosomal protein S20
VANIKSQKKRNRQNETRRQRNLSTRSELRTRVKSAVNAATSGAEDADAQLRTAQKRIDKAGTKGRIHKNAASRRVSRLMKRANQAAAE